MSLNLLTISQASKLVGVSIQTLRRWEYSGKLIAVRKKATGHRYYSKRDIENYIRDNIEKLDLFKIAFNWIKDKVGVEPFSDFYCQNISIFQLQLTKLENELGRIKRLEKIFPLISAITGEIGNNSFDHNLGNWPDIPGIFFAWNLDKGKIILADRGQGILATLKNVKPELSNHQNALKIAFTEIISGRAPEHRGNGLKFVKNVALGNKINLFFWTGNAFLKIEKTDFDINIKKSTFSFRGCLTLINF